MTAVEHLAPACGGGLCVCGAWKDPDGKPYQWSFSSHLGHHYVAGEIPPTAESMVRIVNAGGGARCGRQDSRVTAWRFDR